MSRIHEALQRALSERESSEQSSSPEDIFRLGYTLARRVPDPVHKGAPGPVCAQEAIPESDWQPDRSRLFFVKNGRDGEVREQFRSLRVKLTHQQKQAGIKVLLVASALPAEGKSFVAANLACAFAVQRGCRVLLLDCDLRKGGLARLLGAPQDRGLSDFLRAQCSLADVLQSGLEGALHFISSGMPISEPGELVSGASFEGLLRSLRGSYDWIIIDTPPAIQFADASVIAETCDGVLLILSAGSTPMKLARRALQAFKKPTVVGAVLNRSRDLPLPSRYYGYGDRADTTGH